ncbi:FRG domain-containing protein [Cupriavidus basilensis]
MEKAKAESLSEFIGITDMFDLISDLVIYRGQAFRGGLLPGVARKDRKIDTTTQERKVLDQLRLMGASFSELDQPTELDLLVVAQHFRLKTRLLDWTSNPLAALWFACQDSQEGDTYVYALQADTLQKEGLYTRDPFTVPVTRAFQPRLNNPRILAQHGWFTLHRFSKKVQAFVPLDMNPETEKHLMEIRIPAKFRASILTSLERHGISRRTLFPDLEGLCQFINWKYLR